MKRRKFTLMGASSIAALSTGTMMPRAGKATTPTDKAALLQTTLTPFGAERAGNADGSIPAWTGGVTTVPAGWTPEQNIMPDIFADEKPIVTINAANMAQYADGLCDSVKQLMTASGYSINVYPTHRTASAPQAIYDNIAANAQSTQINPRGARFGFTNAYGGAPFPIPDEDENQGAEIIWNHLTRWEGYNYNRKVSSFSVVNGNVVLGASGPFCVHFSFYEPGGSAATSGNLLDKVHTSIMAPPPSYGDQIIQYDYIDPLQQPAQIWQLLTGQGRVRKAPELAFDTPDPGSQGMQFYDEITAFQGSPVRYNWNCRGKKEMYIPYNSNGMFFAEPSQLLLPHFLNPQYVRWEKHRVWVLDATLAPGERNVILHRRMYVDEDTWMVTLIDEYDGNGDLYKFIALFNELRPDLPGAIYGTTVTQDLQTSNYVYGGAPFENPTYGGPLTTSDLGPQYYSAEIMAANAQY